jgi:O-antigen ligase
MATTNLPISPAPGKTNWRRIVLSISMLAGFALLTYVALVVVNPFRSTLGVILILLAPLVAIFILPSATRALVRGAKDLVKNFKWYHGVWFLVLLSGLVFRERLVQDINEEPIDAWALFRICVATLVGLIMMGRLILKKDPWIRTLLHGVIGIMTAYALISLVSTGWSVRPAWTFYKSAEYLVDLSVLASIVAAAKSTEEFEKFVNWTWILLGILLVSAWIGAVVDPQDALHTGYHMGSLGVRLVGVIPDISANSLGEFSAILAVVALCRLLYDPERKHNRAWYRLLFAFATTTMIFAQTRAAIVGFVFSAFLLLILTRRYLLGVAIGLASSFAGIFLLAFTNTGSLVRDYVLRDSSVSEVEGLSGRVEYWQAAFKHFLERPLIGYGGYAGGRFLVLPELGRYATPDLHSSLVESLVDIGIWGPLLLIAVLIGIWWMLFKAWRSPVLAPSENRLVIEALAVIGVITLRSLESGDIISHPAIAFLTILGCAEFVRRRLKRGELRGQNA